MITAVKTTLAAAAIALGTGAGATTLDLSTFDLSRSQTLLDDTAAVFFDGTADFFEVASDDGRLFLNGFPFADPLDVVLDFNGLPVLTPASQSEIMTETLAFIFEDSGLSYLARVDATGLGVDFTDADGFSDMSGGAVTLEQLAPVPLPAGSPLLLAVLGGVAVAMRRRA